MTELVAVDSTRQFGGLGRELFVAVGELPALAPRAVGRRVGIAAVDEGGLFRDKRGRHSQGSWRDGWGELGPDASLKGRTDASQAYLTNHGVTDATD